MTAVKVQFLQVTILLCMQFAYVQPVLAQSQGPSSPGSLSNNIIGGSVAWSSPANTSASDNVYTTATNGTSNYLTASNFGFSIPLNATITGIVAEVEKKGAPVNAVAANNWVTFTSPNYTSGTATSLYGSTSYSYNLPVSSLTNNRRLLVVTIAIEIADNVGANDPSVTFGNATYNGIPMTLAVSSTRASATTSNSVAVYYLAESGLPSLTGNRNLVISKTINGESSGGSISPAEYVEIVGVNTYTNVEQATPVTAVSQTTAASPISSPSINNVRNGDFIIAATTNNTPSASGGSVTQGSGYTENFETSHNNTGGSTSGAILEVQSRSLAGVTGTPSVTASATAAGASRLAMCALSINAARVYDNSVMLTNALGLRTGSDLAITPSAVLSNAWPDADAYQTYGSSSNLWGTSWSPLDINSPAFGLSFQANASNSIASVDHVRITVYYSITLSVSLHSFTLTHTLEEVTAWFACDATDAKPYRITLERAGADMNFISVSSIDFAKSYQIQQLKIKDEAPASGTVYYRLRMEEAGDEASIKYSAVQKISSESEAKQVATYPNPASDHILVRSGQAIKSVSLFDSKGMNVPVYVGIVDVNVIRVDNLPAKGVYTLVVHLESDIVSKRIIID